VQLVLYPLALNPAANLRVRCGTTAWCAGEQGKFWDFHHMLYRRQELWNRFAAPLERLSDFANDRDPRSYSAQELRLRWSYADSWPADRTIASNLQVKQYTDAVHQ